MSEPLRIGTRGSALALAQAGWVAERVGGELVEITTAGDLNRAAGDKSRWTGALEGALVLGEIDLAVHSAKDVPGELGDGLGLVAATGRVDAADVLCGAESLDALPAGARIGTSALRRRAQLLAARDDVEVVELRGNVDTRLRKLADGEVDAIVLARAGLERLDRLDAVGAELRGEVFVPAAGQGVLTLEARLDDVRATAAARLAHDDVAWACLTAERALVRTLGADCHSAVGGHAELADGVLSMRAFAGAPDGSEWIVDEAAGDADDPDALGAELGRRMLVAGAGELLAR
ncbi:MAG: Porphobilinogen deaminase [uncultured Solirubrobacteraceae bacterium]|uniref:Hydroxymethylbilane synthase n=1 Tax=uncultured Solirubrobacteraceae bacterium TaxID=1162706 RepID=A0A6J4U0R2_9ACTN|nr:MAG: Porphobilinogen deaminase [uncultured Solirubrobacteraceae bacterium]